MGTTFPANAPGVKPPPQSSSAENISMVWTSPSIQRTYSPLHPKQAPKHGHWAGSALQTLARDKSVFVCVKNK